MRMLLNALGILMVLCGALFTMQGLGIVRWPADSFMVGVSDWVWRGGLLALGGLILLWTARPR